MATSTRIIAFKARRKLLRSIGGLAFWGGAIFLLLDVTTPFPTPVRGAYASWWLLVVAAGAVVWVLSRKLPSLELLDLAEMHNGELSIPTVMQELSLPQSMAAAALEAIAEEDLASEKQSGKQRIWTFHGIDNDNDNSPTITINQSNPNNN
jgi:hypothetical protein